MLVDSNNSSQYLVSVRQYSCGSYGLNNFKPLIICGDVKLCECAIFDIWSMHFASPFLHMHSRYNIISKSNHAHNYNYEKKRKMTFNLISTNKRLISIIVNQTLPTVLWQTHLAVYFVKLLLWIWPDFNVQTRHNTRQST